MTSETQDAADAPAGVFFLKGSDFWRLISSNAGFKAALSPRMPVCPTCSQLKNGFMRGGWQGFCGSPENTKN